jgi:hypothetical protein
MPKFLKWLLISLVVVAIALFGLFRYFMAETKKASPEEIVHFEEAGFDLELYYNRPSKKERVIFGELVPYGKVWRTGANEATTFSSASDLIIEGQKLAAGKYSLWTIPGEKTWKVIFNKKMYSWGLGWGGEVPREPEYDALVVEVPNLTSDVTEKFTIKFEATPSGAIMVLLWDETKVPVKLSLDQD